MCASISGVDLNTRWNQLLALYLQRDAPKAQFFCKSEFSKVADGRLVRVQRFGRAPIKKSEYFP
jgi:hypothetical protein